MGRNDGLAAQIREVLGDVRDNPVANTRPCTSKRMSRAIEKMA